MVRHDHDDVHGLFSLPHGRRSAALEGQHCDQEPQKETEKRTHGHMVPQIKNMHQGTPPARWTVSGLVGGRAYRSTRFGQWFSARLPTGPPSFRLGLVRMPTASALYRHSGTVY